MSFNLQKYFKDQYLLEGDWDKLSSTEASDEADDIIWFLKKVDDHHQLITSDYFMSREEFINQEFEAKIAFFEEE